MRLLGTIEDVKNFWEKFPLFTGESKFPQGTFEFYQEHRDTVIKDCFAGMLDERIFPKIENSEKILDLGCGPGFWLIEFRNRGFTNLVGADLTEAALQLAQRRCSFFDANVYLLQENAESLSFQNSTFSHVNCQGVIHHTPNTENCIREIARVLRKGGTASVSVYYQNIFLRLWPVLKYPAKFMAICGAKIKGRGRDEIFVLNKSEDIVRVYDGIENPIGKAYTVQEIAKMVEPYFIVEEVFFHFFPARALPFHIPVWLHKFLDKYFGFMLYVNLKKL